MEREIKLKASLTVEGSAIISICIIVIGMCIMLAFTIYHESMSYIDQVKIHEMDSVDTFRKIKLGKELVEDIIH